MTKLVIGMLLMPTIIGCGDSRYTFDMDTWDGADAICSENKGIKSLTVARHFPPELIVDGAAGAIDVVVCNDGAVYSNRSGKRYPVKAVGGENDI